MKIQLIELQSTNTFQPRNDEFITWFRETGPVEKCTTYGEFFD